MKEKKTNERADSIECFVEFETFRKKFEEELWNEGEI